MFRLLGLATLFSGRRVALIWWGVGLSGVLASSARGRKARRCEIRLAERGWARGLCEG